MRVLFVVGVAALTATGTLWWVWQGDLGRAAPAVRWWWGA